MNRKEVETYVWRDSVDPTTILFGCATPRGYVSFCSMFEDNIDDMFDMETWNAIHTLKYGEPVRVKLSLEFL